MRSGTTILSADARIVLQLRATARFSARLEFHAYRLALLWQIVRDGLSDEFIAMRASPWRWPCKEVKNGLPDGRHGRLWRWPSDSFFSVPLL